MNRCPDCLSQYPWKRNYVTKRIYKSALGTIVTSKVCDNEFHNPA